MTQGIRRLFTLVAVFLVAFALVYTIRNGPQGIKRLVGAPEDGPSYRPEAFTLPERAALDLDEVELLSRLNEEFVKVTDAVVESVVSIDTTGVSAQRWLDGLGRQLVRPVPTMGEGSGVIVSREGHVVTNHHVVKNQQQIQVTLHDGRSYAAELIGEDPLLDVAVLKIDAPGPFEPLKFGDSEQVRRGQIVFAIGNPFGLGETVTQGIISAVERSLSDTQRDLIQTDAAINPGNSGGPLVNLRGEIVGINSAIYRPDERVNSGFQGVGFSIPANDVKDTLYAILERGRPVRGYLGVSMHPDPHRKQALGYEGPGVAIHGIGPDSPAEAAGLRPDDVIVRFDGESIDSLAELVALVQRSRVGQRVVIDIWRAGERLELEARIGESRVELSRRAVEPPDRTRERGEVLEAMGVMVHDVGRELGGSGQRGVVVTGLRRGGLAADKLEVGDVVLSINRSRVRNAAEFDLQLAASAAAQSTSLEIRRDGQALLVTLPPLPRERDEASGDS